MKRGETPDKKRWNKGFSGKLKDIFANLHRLEPPGDGLIHDSIHNDVWQNEIWKTHFKELGIDKARFLRNYKNCVTEFQDAINGYGWRYRNFEACSPEKIAIKKASPTIAKINFKPSEKASPATAKKSSKSPPLSKEATLHEDTTVKEKKNKKKGLVPEFFGCSSYSQRNDIMPPSICVLNANGNKIKYTFSVPVGFDPNSFRFSRAKDDDALRIEMVMPSLFYDVTKLYDAKDESCHVWRASMMETLLDQKRTTLLMKVYSPFQIGQFTTVCHSFQIFRDEMNTMKNTANAITMRLQELEGEKPPHADVKLCKKRLNQLSSNYAKLKKVKHHVIEITMHEFDIKEV